MSSILILTGAGISAPAGIPTFQELYRPIIDSDDPDSLKELLMNKIAENLVTDLGTQQFEPTLMHRRIKKLASNRVTFTFTTNVDNLHEQTGIYASHIHGTIKDPVLFGDVPRLLDRFTRLLETASLVVVIGSQLAYPYLSIPITEWSLNSEEPALLLDTDENHPLANSFNHVWNEDLFGLAFDKYTGVDTSSVQ